MNDYKVVSLYLSSLNNFSLFSKTHYQWYNIMTIIYIILLLLMMMFDLKRRHIYIYMCSHPLIQIDKLLWFTTTSDRWNEILKLIFLWLWLLILLIMSFFIIYYCTVEFIHKKNQLAVINKNFVLKRTIDLVKWLIFI